jgi:predicted metalloprotease
MKWRRKKARGRDVVDVRGAAPKGGSSSSSGGFGGLPIPGNIAGVGGGAGLVVVLVIVAIQIFGGGGSGGGGFAIDDVFGPGVQAPGAADESPIPANQDPQRDLFEFSDHVFNDAQQTWVGTFSEDGEPYDRAVRAPGTSAPSGPDRTPEFVSYTATNPGVSGGDGAGG